MDCLFCSIIKREIPSEIVYEDERTFAFLDIHPKASRHTLIVPKIHAETILELPVSEREPLWAAVVAVQTLIIKSIKPDGFTIGINQQKAAGQEIDHLHLHVIPRFLNDGGGPIQMVVSNIKN